MPNFTRSRLGKFTTLRWNRIRGYRASETIFQTYLCDPVLTPIIIRRSSSNVPAHLDVRRPPKKLIKNRVFEPKVLQYVQHHPLRPRNIIYDEYRLIPLRRSKLEVIRVLDHDFKADGSLKTLISP